MRQRKPFQRYVDKTRTNGDIREKEVRVIDDKGEHLGVMLIEDAMAKAEATRLDLVEVATGGEHSVCRIMDYGQFKFEQAKRQREAKKKQKVIVLKEIKLRPRTDTHDYEFKIKHAREFLENGHKVKFTMVYRGRELAYKDMGRKVLMRIQDDLKDYADVESAPRFEGRAMHMVVAPLPKPKIKKSRMPEQEDSAQVEGNTEKP